MVWGCLYDIYQRVIIRPMIAGLGISTGLVTLFFCSLDFYSILLRLQVNYSIVSTRIRSIR